jgi:hypothetical protein
MSRYGAGLRLSDRRVRRCTGSLTADSWATGIQHSRPSAVCLPVRKNWLLPILGFRPADDEHIEATILRIADELTGRDSSYATGSRDRQGLTLLRADERMVDARKSHAFVS